MAMTEQEWLACNDPALMLEHLRGKVSDRKLRLFAVACCRRIMHLLEDRSSREAVEVAELAMEGLVTTSERQAAATVALDVVTEMAVRRSNRTVDGVPSAWECAAHAAWLAANDSVNAEAVANRVQRAAGSDAQKAWQVSALRDIFGPFPFRPVTITPAWRTSNVTALAQSIYDDRAFDRLPILADALEDAGCDGSDILNHCRQPGEHVRGCWVVDLVLGKE
jgi:hypothetical protein